MTCGLNSRTTRTSASVDSSQRDQREAALGQRRQRVALGQPRVDEAQPGVLDAEDLGRLGHLLAADLVDPVRHPGHVHRGVEDVATFAAGQRHHQHAVPSAAYRAVVAAPLLDSSSGWACTAMSRNPLTCSLITCAGGLGPVQLYSSSRSTSIRPTGTQNCHDERPADRYGRQRLSRRARRWIAAGLRCSSSSSGSGRVRRLQRLGSGEVEGKLVGYRLVDDETITVTITVTREDPSRPVVCIVRARSMDGCETGRREVLVPPSAQATVEVTTIVKSSRPPVMGDVYGCGTDVPAYLVGS